MQQAINTLSTLKSFCHKDDGTYDFASGKMIEYTSGYQVSFVRPEAFECLSCDGWDIISSHLSEHLSSALHIGVYQGEAEISFYTSSEEKATQTMETYNQESMLDWAKKKQYPETSIDWFIFNRLYDETKVLDYDKIIEEIQ